MAVEKYITRTFPSFSGKIFVFNMDTNESGEYDFEIFGDLSEDEVGNIQELALQSVAEDNNLNADNLMGKIRGGFTKSSKTVRQTVKDFIANGEVVPTKEIKLTTKPKA